ncbi:hypothetical protein [Fodinibius sp. AD559]|uniref:hypothetical protein n=1 Tax=Fodinibius sp. AD559 TaxID=3424179 RepID=UPI004046DADD
MFKKYFAVLFVPFLFFATNTIAQDNAQKASSSKFDAVVKISGIAPTVGASYSSGSYGRLRATGFVLVNSLGNSILDNYLLDLSYLKNTERMSSESITTYWGINLHIQFEDPVIGPGLVLGSIYMMDEHFAIFGELGFNAFIFDDGNNTEVGMLNSGIGIKIGL